MSPPPKKRRPIPPTESCASADGFDVGTDVRPGRQQGLDWPGGGLARYVESLQAARGDPRRQLRLIVGFDRRLYEKSHDVIVIGRDTGRVDADVRAWVAEGERRHREGPRPVVAGWAALGALAPGLGEQEAADVLATFTNFDVYRLLVLESGWTNDRYEAWLGASLERLLFGT